MSFDKNTRDNHTNSTSSSNPSDNEDENRDVQQGCRRDENAISFRHFLQPQSDVVPTRHQRPSPRGGTSAPVDLVDIPGGLPDFVQDHLVIEAQAFDDSYTSHEPHPVPNPESPLDLALINELMPNLFNPSQRRIHNASGDVEIENLGAYGPAPDGIPTLPDFLSDGPMHYDASTTANSSEITMNPNRPAGNHWRLESARCRAAEGSGSLGRAQARNTSYVLESFSQQIQNLERDIEERNRRIRELENVVLDQKTELLKCYQIINQQLRENSSNSQDHVVPLSPRATTRSLLNGDGDGDEEGVNERDRSVREIASRAESLIEELMREIQRLKLR